MHKVPLIKLFQRLHLKKKKKKKKKKSMGANNSKIAIKSMNENPHFQAFFLLTNCYLLLTVITQQGRAEGNYFKLQGIWFFFSLIKGTLFYSLTHTTSIEHLKHLQSEFLYNLLYFI